MNKKKSFALVSFLFVMIFVLLQTQNSIVYASSPNVLGCYDPEDPENDLRNENSTGLSLVLTYCGGNLSEGHIENGYSSLDNTHPEDDVLDIEGIWSKCPDDPSSKCVYKLGTDRGLEWRVWKSPDLPEGYLYLSGASDCDPFNGCGWKEAGFGSWTVPSGLPSYTILLKDVTHCYGGVCIGEPDDPIPTTSFATCNDRSYNGVVLFDDLYCLGSNNYWDYPLTVINPSSQTSAVYVKDGWSVLLNGSDSTQIMCTDKSLWDLSMDYYPGTSISMDNTITTIEVYESDTTCNGYAGGVGDSGGPIGGNGSVDGSGAVQTLLSIYDTTSYGGNLLYEFGSGIHTIPVNTLTLSHDLVSGGSFIVTDDTGNDQCFDSDVPNMQDNSNYWNKTVEVEVFSSNVCGGINGQVKIYNATNYGGSLIGTYTGGNSYTFPVDTLMFSFDLEGSGSYVVTAPDGRRKCFNEDVPNMQDYSEYWRETVKLEVNKHDLCPAEGVPAAIVGSGNGLWRNEFHVLWDEVDIPNLSTIAPTSWGPVSNVTLDNIVREKLFGIRFDGCITLPYTDEYNFYLTSADGSQLTINNLGVVDNNGLHNPNEESGKLIVSAGTYPLKIDFYTNDNSYELDLEVETTLLSRQAVPNSWLSYGGSCPVVTDAGPLLVGEWNFDSFAGTTVTDTVGVNNLTVTNASVLGSTGIFTDGLSTDGTNYAYISNPSNLLRPENDEPLTISFWVQGNTTTGLDYSFLSLMQQPGYPDAGWWLRMDKSTGNITYFYGRNGIGFNHATGTGLTGLLDGDPHHIAISFEGTSSDNTMRAYKDGVLVGTNNIGGSGPIAYHSNMALYIANSTAATVDEVKLYRDELSQSEVYDIYADGVTELYGEIGLLGHFDFESVSGTVVTDTVGSNDLTLTNSSIVTTGIFSDSLNTDGSNYAYHTNASTALKPANDNPFSISFWVRGEASTGFDYRFLGNMHQDGYNDVGWFIRMDKSSGQLTYFYGRDGLGFNHATGLAITNLLDGEAHHVAITFTGMGSDKTIKTYRDGVLVDNKQISGSGPIAYHSNMALYVANTTDAELDELKFYNRVLPATEVLAAYNLNVNDVYTPPPPPSDLALNWTYSQTLTISNTQVLSDLTGFPILIDETVLPSSVFSTTQQSTLPFGSTSVSTANLAGYWKFDETSGTTLVDQQGGNNFTATNTSVVGNAGIFGNGLTTDGTNYASKTNTSSALKPGDNSPFSVSFWIDGQTSSGTDYYFLSNLHTNTTDAGWWLVMSKSTGQLTYFYGKNGTGQNHATGLAITGLLDGNPHHVTITFTGMNGGKTIRTYKDGVLIDNKSISGSGSITYHSTMALFVARSTIATVDDLVIFNRTLSATEVTQIYQESAEITHEDSIRFTSDATGNNELPFEIVSFDAQNQTAEIWVKTDVSASVDTPIYLWYGNESAQAYSVSDPYGARNVWASYLGSYHLADLTNSASAAFGLTPNATPTSVSSAYIGAGYDWDGNDDNLRATLSGYTPFNGTWSFSTWINPDSLGEGATGDWARVFDMGGKSFMRLESGSTDYNLKFTQIYDGPNGGWQTTSDPITQNQWNHVVVVFDGSTAGNAPLIFVNGVSVNVSNYAAPSGTIETSTTFNIGNNQNTGVRTFDGTIDETYLVNGGLSSAWIYAMYVNQSTPSSFFVTP